MQMPRRATIFAWLVSLPFLLLVTDSGPWILSLNDPGLVSNNILPFWVQLLIAEWDHNLPQSFPGIFLEE